MANIIGGIITLILLLISIKTYRLIHLKKPEPYHMDKKGKHKIYEYVELQPTSTVMGRTVNHGTPLQTAELGLCIDAVIILILGFCFMKTVTHTQLATLAGQLGLMFLFFLAIENICEALHMTRKGCQHISIKTLTTIAIILLTATLICFCFVNMQTEQAFGFYLATAVIVIIVIRGTLWYIKRSSKNE